MKNRFKLSLITLLIFVVSCGRQKENNPQYAANLEIAKSFMLAHSTEDIAAQSAMIHDDLKWHMPVYGSEMADAQGLKNALAYYQNEFDNLNFTADYWLSGVDETTGLFDGSTRVYGTWTADHVASGKSIKLTSYHSFAFTDGKISGGGDWFDFGGMMNSLAADTEAATEE
jgi:hypothetical protein